MTGVTRAYVRRDKMEMDYRQTAGACDGLTVDALPQTRVRRSAPV